MTCKCGCGKHALSGNKFIHGHNARASVGNKCLISDCHEQRRGRYCVTHKALIYTNRSYPGRAGRFTTAEFIARAQSLHGNKYDYSLSKYIKAHVKVIIICPIHGQFSKKPTFHLRGQGCPACSARLLTEQEFIEKCKKRHGDRFDYTQTLYTGYAKPITVICRIHGQFTQIAEVHLNRHGCPYCSGKRLTASRNLKTLFPELCTEFSSANVNAPDQYSAFSQRKALWICKVCKYEWWSTISNRTGKNKQGCPACAGQVVTDRNRLSILSPEIAAEWYQPLNGDTTPDQISIGSARKKFYFRCGKCSHIWQSDISHRHGGRGCPKCRESKGERRLGEILITKGIQFERQKILPTLSSYRFDFGISLGAKLVLIEYYGEQHYKPFRFKGASRKFRQCLRNDKIKQEFCDRNNIPLLIINYGEFDRMEERISAFVEAHT